MSLQLLNKIAGNTQGAFRQFLDRFNGNSEPRIAWYPSAGKDYRTLLYLNSRYTRTRPALHPEPDMPDLFIHTDFNGDQRIGLQEHRVLFRDHRTQITASTTELIRRISVRANQELTEGSAGHDLEGNCYFATLTVNSDKLGDFETHLLYCFIENTFFFKHYLLPLEACISHLIHVRYGGGLGGSRASGVWLRHALGLLRTEVFIHDETNHWLRGDQYAIAYCPALADQPEPNLIPLRTTNAGKWNGYGDVSWNLVRIRPCNQNCYAN